MKLNEKQERAFNECVAGKNVFLTGSGGVGKSVLSLRLKEHFEHNAVFLAPTGIAALNIEGATCHRTFGLPFSIASEEDFWNINPMTKDLFYDNTITTIIIDEISMVRADMFICMDRKLRQIKDLELPFGGLQIIVIGDFFQLPPVLTQRDEDAYYQIYDSLYAFGTGSWDECKFELIELDQVMRQNDIPTIRALNCIRRGIKSDVIINWINKQCEGVVLAEDAITLCTTNANASNINSMYYDENDHPEHTFWAQTTGRFNEQPVDKELKLKVGIRVVLCANGAMQGYSNGQCGEITDIDPECITVMLDTGYSVKVEPHKWESYAYKVSGRRLSKQVDGTFKQFPLKLGYAITIHKAQGVTLDECILDLGNGAFVHGQTYVALSRIRALNTLELERPIYESDIIVDPEVIEFYSQF